jgi:ATP-dependent protease HslVU (ClpYQ) peptidase subunit
MTTIATDGRAMAADGLVHDHCDTIVDRDCRKVFRLADGRIAGGAGNAFDVLAWVNWLDAAKSGPCPIEGTQFSGLILDPSGTVLWVDHKGREGVTPVPAAVGSGQDYAYGAMDAGADPAEAVRIATLRDVYSGGYIHIEALA